MIGTLDTSRREATVVGAGIAGMLAAYALENRGYCVTLIEAQERAGGLIKTTSTKHGLAESAAHSLVATAAVRELCADLGVELIAPRKESHAKFIVRDGKLRRFPLGIREAAGALRRAAFVPADNVAAQSLDGWARKHLGSVALDYLLTPLVRGIYGVQPAELGVAAAYPGLQVQAGQTLLGALLHKKRTSSAKRETKERAAPQFGMGELVGKLEKRLEQKLGARFRKQERISDVPAAPNVIIATPATAAAAILRQAAPALAARLETVKYTPIVSVTVFVSRAAFTHPIHGTGVLMPACEDRKALGILFNSDSFANRVADDAHFASFTVMLGGTAQRQWLEASDDEIRQAIKLELSAVLGIREPQTVLIHRWPAALPQYSPDLPAIWQQARDSWCALPGRILFGNYTGQISLRGMIESAARLGSEPLE
jgi:protoporphyrinogen/coproporphyrinogen III oxidase